MNEYWNNITDIYEKQREKGVKKYGQVLEENQAMTIEERITYAQEELIDGLMYLEHLKDKYIQLEKKIESAYAIANNSIYFNDRHDYLTALYDVCKTLRPNIDEDIHGNEFIE